MSMRFCILGSGSDGNCALLQTDQARILIDAGFSARRIARLLGEVGESLEQIDAIFLTHEHGDHAGGVGGLARYPQIRIFANVATARAVQAGIKHQPVWQYFETGSRFRYRDLEVETFAVPHDAHDPVAFLFTHTADAQITPGGRLAWVTDLGHAPANIRERIREADVLVLEANYCPELLKADLKRPWAVKQRISGRHGHLSNESVKELLITATAPRWRHVFFAHLSRDCNSPAAVEAVCAAARTTLRCEFSIVHPGAGTPFFVF
jgi:phosphoribosyl 1,2-cyclic phosphodiesterase